MKRFLPCAGALAGLALATQPAAGQITVTLGGMLEFEGGWRGLDARGTKAVEFRTDNDLLVRAAGKTDNGLEYGTYVLVVSDQDEARSVDEANLFVAGRWGTLELGAQDGASDQLAVIAPTIGNGQIEALGFAQWFGAVLDPEAKIFDSDDAAKITYLSPSLAGFQFGASYAPAAVFYGIGGSAGSVDLLASAGHFKDLGLLAVKYAGSLGPAAVALGSGHAFARSEAGQGDFAGWQLGAQAGFGGLTLGGALWRNAFERAGVAKGWNAGATYAAGAFGVGGSLGTDERAGHRKFHSLGLAYTVAPGLVASADLNFLNAEAGAHEGTVLVTSLRMVF